TPLAHDTRALRQLAAQPPERRAQVIEAITSGKAADVSAAVTIAMGGQPVTPVQTPVDQSVKAFRKVWADATPSARAAILADLAGRSLPKGWTVREDR
ncbi:MAG: hypothetical protein U1C74_32725, partial [Phenylobacterium sp.]|nr:hypothetical protein [Phenylobacterium sp.]